MEIKEEPLPVVGFSFVAELLNTSEISPFPEPFTTSGITASLFLIVNALRVMLS